MILHFCCEILLSQFTHFFRRILGTEKVESADWVAFRMYGYQYALLMFSGYQYLYWWDQCRYKYLSHQYQKQLPILFKILIDGIFDANLNSCLIVLSVESRKLIVFNQTNAWSLPSLDKYDNAIKKTWYWNF